MRKRNWQIVATQSPKVKLTEDLRSTVEMQAQEIVKALNRQRRKPKKPRWNWCESVFTRWHRGSLYFVAVMRTPHGRPESFESHLARLEYVGGEKFQVAFPMRRGWMCAMPDSSLEVCLNEVSRCLPHSF